MLYDVIKRVIPGPKNLSDIYFIGVAFSALRLLTAAFSTVYLLNNGLSVADISFAKSYQLGFLLLFDILIGRFSDRYGHMLSVLLSVFFCVLYLAFMPSVSSFPLLIVAETLNAISLALFSGAFDILLKNAIEDKSKDSVAKTMGKFTQYQFISIAIASSGGALLADQIGQSYVWYLASFLLFGALIIISIRHLNSFDVRRTQPMQKVDNELSNIFIVLRKNYFLVALLTIIVPIYEAFLVYWQAFYLVESDRSNKFFGLIFLCFLLIQAFSGKALSLSVRNRKKLISCSTIAVFASLFYLAVFNAFVLPITILLMALFFILKLLMVEFIARFTAQLSGTSQATYQSALSTVLRASTAISIGILGIYYESTSITTFLISVTFIALLPIFIYLFTRGHEKS